MSDTLVTCPSCGLEVPEGRFCKICGEPLEVDESIRLPELEFNSKEEPESITPLVELEKVELPHFEISIEDMDNEAAVVLLSRSELDVVDMELDSIIERTKATRQALQLQQANKDVLNARAEELRDEFEKTKNRRRELAAVSTPLVLERVLDALDRDEERLEKLEAISSTIDKNVYKEQRREILHSIKDLRENLKSAIKTAKKWVKGTKKTIKTLNKELSRVEAKFKIGDISRDAYDSSKTRLERSIKIVEGGQKRLISLLRIAEER